MDLAKYTELTGTTVAQEDETRYNAIINRVNSLLESALGYSLDPEQNLDKEELGKVQFQGAYPYYPVNQTTLLPADEVEGSYRLFYYNDKDLYIKTDPARNIYHVKLVQAQNDDSFVTIMDLNDFTSKNSRNFGKFIQKSIGWFNWDWYGWLVEQVGNGNGLMVAVDGDWLDYENVPNDLSYLWADMVTYYSSDNVSVTGNLKSESINGHSYSFTNAGGGKGEDLTPDQSIGGSKILAQYAGPNGTANPRNPA